MKKLLFSLILIITLVGCSTINDVNNKSSKEADEQGSNKSISQIGYKRNARHLMHPIKFRLPGRYYRQRRL